MSDEQPDAQSWKRKYLQALDDLERKEQHWQELEQVLRLAVSRVTLAVGEVEERLGRELAAVREAVRGELDVRALRHSLDTIGELLRQADEQARAPKAVDLTALVRLLERLDVPRGLRRKARQLTERLAAQPAPPLEQALGEVNAFVGEIAQWLAEERVPGEGGGKASLLDRVLGRGGEGKAAREPDEAQPERSATPVSRSIEPSVEQLAVQALLEALERTPLPAEHRAELRSRASSVTTQGQFFEFVQALVHGLTSSGEPASAEWPPHEVLIQLIDRLQLPGELSGRARALAERLATGLEGTAVSSALSELADLVAQARLQVQAEKQALEGFLTQLTDRLQDLDHSLVESATSRREASARRRDFDARLGTEVQGLGATVQGAADLEFLKSSIQTRIDTIQRHMEDRRRYEAEREAQTEREIQGLTERLQAMEGETRVLRERVLEERRLALRDPLTGLPNRLAYDERMAQEYERWKRYRRPLAVSVWDVDRFKQINDSYGHKAGDRVLSIIARLLQQNVRATDFVARYGGEEFVVLMPETELEGARIVAEKLRATVEAAETHFKGQPVKITISAGLTLLGEQDTVESVFERADRGLYQAKAEGRNRCVAV